MLCSIVWWLLFLVKKFTYKIMSVLFYFICKITWQWKFKMWQPIVFHLPPVGSWTKKLILSPDTKDWLRIYTSAAHWLFACSQTGLLWFLSTSLLGQCPRERHKLYTRKDIKIGQQKGNIIHIGYNKGNIIKCFLSPTIAYLTFGQGNRQAYCLMRSPSCLKSWFKIF